MPTVQETFVLLISRDAVAIKSVRDGLSNGDDKFRVQCVETVETATARIAGGGVDVVLLDLARLSALPNQKFDAFLDFYRTSPAVPVVILCEPGAEGLAVEAVRVGAADYWIKQQTNVRLDALVHEAIARSRARISASKTVSRAGGKVIAFMGAKGGVGTTATALNVASALSKESTVILAELSSAQGTLRHYFHPRGPQKTIGDLLDLQSDRICEADVQACLWTHMSIPGLRILLAPQMIQPRPEDASESVRTILQLLTTFAEYVVVDLPAWWSKERQCAIAHSDFLALVIERDPVCIEVAKLLLLSLAALEHGPHLTEAVVVNRTALSCPVPLPDIEVQLGIRVAGVIPPGADVCSAAQRARLPVVAFEAGGALAASFYALAKSLAGAMAPLIGNAETAHWKLGADGC